MIPFNPNEFHHLYIGILLVILGMVFLVVYFLTGKKSWEKWAVGLLFFGLWIALDDYSYHLNGRSPFHSAFAYFYHRCEWIRDVTAWFDHLFGKG